MHLTRPHKAIRKCSWRTGLMFCWRRSKPQFLPRIFTTEAQRHRGKSAVQYSHSFCEADKELISSLCLCDSVVNKKAEARRPRLQLAGCPDKIWYRYRRTQTWRMYDALKRRPAENFRYAVLRGRTVRSRTCARMLDICIPFSCARNGSISATNGSCTNSRISSWRLRSPPVRRSGTVTSSARASRSSDESVGVAFSFSIFDT